MSFMSSFHDIVGLIAQSTDQADEACENALSDLVVAEAFAAETGGDPETIADLVDVQLRKNTLRAHGVDVDDDPHPNDFDTFR